MLLSISQIYDICKSTHPKCVTVTWGGWSIWCSVIKCVLIKIIRLYSLSVTGSCNNHLSNKF